ncbi:MAG TPA: helix-turn-helix domain-containing protein [Verrucomicrobiae bacterium]
MDSTAALYLALKRSAFFREVRRAFCGATGLSLELVRVGALAERTVSPRRPMGFCALLATSSGPCDACLEVQRELHHRLVRKLAPRQVRCFAGLTELAVPVIINGKQAATLVSGRVFQQKPARRQFRRLVRQLHQWGMRGNLRALERAYFKMPVVPFMRFQGSVRLLTILARELGERASRLVLSKVPGDPAPVARAKAFLLAHAADGVTLKQAADQAHLSRHHFCRVFKHSTGITLTDFLARVRVEMVKNLLGNRELRITEAADRAGFQSISQFNRIFRRCTGTSPSGFRATLLPGSNIPGCFEQSLRKESELLRSAAPPPG